MTGDTNASGFNVLSDEYSNPGFNILTSSSLLIVVESGNKLANEGKLLYPTPPKLIFTSLIEPLALVDLVV